MKLTFGSWLAQEHTKKTDTVAPVVTETVTTTTKEVEPSFKDLVQKMVEEKHTASEISAPTEEKPIEPILPGIEIPVIPTETVPTEQTVIEEPKQEFPKLAPEIVPIKVDEKFSEGLFFVKTMLSEFSDLLTAGNELQKIEADRIKSSENASQIANEIKNKIEKRNVLRDSLVGLLTEENDNPEQLNTALKSYQEYLDSVEAAYSATLDEEQKKGNDLLNLMATKRNQIKDLIEKVGGNDAFKKMKEVVSFCKKRRQEYLDEQYKENPNLKPSLVEAITKDINSFVELDLTGSKMLLEQGNIINILMSVFANKQK